MLRKIEMLTRTNNETVGPGKTEMPRRSGKMTLSRIAPIMSISGGIAAFGPRAARVHFVCH